MNAQKIWNELNPLERVRRFPELSPVCCGVSWTSLDDEDRVIVITQVLKDYAKERK